MPPWPLLVKSVLWSTSLAFSAQTHIFPFDSPLFHYDSTSYHALHVCVKCKDLVMRWCLSRMAVASLDNWPQWACYSHPASLSQLLRSLRSRDQWFICTALWCFLAASTAHGVLISLAGAPNGSGMTTLPHSNTQLRQPGVVGTKLNTTRSPIQRSRCLIYVAMHQWVPVYVPAGVLPSLRWPFCPGSPIADLRLLKQSYFQKILTSVNSFTFALL